MNFKFLRSSVVRWVARRLRVPMDIHQSYYHSKQSRGVDRLGHPYGASK